MAACRNPRFRTPGGQKYDIRKNCGEPEIRKNVDIQKTAHLKISRGTGNPEEREYSKNGTLEKIAGDLKSRKKRSYSTKTGHLKNERFQKNYNSGNDNDNDNENENENENDNDNDHDDDNDYDDDDNDEDDDDDDGDDDVDWEGRPPCPMVVNVKRVGVTDLDARL